jgi:hypothetical protein
MSIQGTDYLAARGNKTISVSPGTVTNESVTVAAHNTGGVGIFSYDIRLSLDIAGLTKALLTLESLDTETAYKIKLT